MDFVGLEMNPTVSLHQHQDTSTPVVSLNHVKFTESEYSKGFTSSASTCLLLGIAGLMGMCLLGTFEKTSRGISFWAKRNPWKTRMAIGFAQIGIGAAGLLPGHNLYEAGIMIPEYARWAGAGLFATAAIFYPSKYFSNGCLPFHYLERKFHDVGLITAGAILVMYSGNHYYIATQPIYPAFSVASISPPGEKIGTISFAKNKITLVKKEFRQKLKTLLQDPENKRTRGEKAVLTILAVLGFVALTFGVAALSCNIACSGMKLAPLSYSRGFSAHCMGLGGDDSRNS